MKNIKKILFPTDFSAMSMMGYRYCLQLARELKASVHVINVYRMDFGVPVPENMAYTMIEERKRNAHIGLEKFAQLKDLTDKSLLEGIDVHAHAAVGFPEDEIVRFAQDNAIDLIVMPTKGEHNMLEAIFGSVTTAVVANATSSLLIIPEGTEYKPLKNIAYATDLSMDNIQHIDRAIGIARLYKAALHYIHINSDQAASKAQVEDLLSANNKGVEVTFHELKGDSVQAGMKSFLQLKEIDLLMTYSPPKNFFERLFRLSNTRFMVENIYVPMLVVR